MAVWTLETDTGFTAFNFIFEKDKIFFQELVKDYFEESKSVIARWRPLSMLRSEPKKHPDFFSINDTDVIAISDRAFDRLKDFLKVGIELLPIDTDAGKYYALNVLKFVDCLDKKESKYEVTKGGLIIKYSLLDFIEDKIGDNKIFKIPEMPYQILITQDFAYQVEEEDLKGLFFDQNINLLWYPE